MRSTRAGPERARNQRSNAVAMSTSFGPSATPGAFNGLPLGRDMTETAPITLNASYSAAAAMRAWAAAARSRAFCSIERRRKARRIGFNANIASNAVTMFTAAAR